MMGCSLGKNESLNDILPIFHCKVLLEHACDTSPTFLHQAWIGTLEHELDDDASEIFHGPTALHKIVPQFLG